MSLPSATLLPIAFLLPALCLLTSALGWGVVSLLSSGNARLLARCALILLRPLLLLLWRGLTLRGLLSVLLLLWPLLRLLCTSLRLSLPLLLLGVLRRSLPLLGRLRVLFPLWLLALFRLASIL